MIYSLAAARSDQERSRFMAQTIYLPIKLNSTVLPKVGVFIPEHFEPTTAVDLIVYFHGHIISACETLPTPFSKDGIEYYWGTPHFQCLRDELTASKTNAVLIAPTFTTKLGNSDAATYGSLNAKGKFDFLIGETLKRLKDSGALPAAVNAGKIILSGHSAGGLPMMRILEANNTLKSNIAECWGFECLYFGTDGWEEWLSANPNKQFQHFRQSSQQVKAAKELKDQKNFIDVANGKDHCRLVREKWREAINASPALKAPGAMV
jgi:hypothetical protein